jgi:hypothetical protein
VSGVREREKGQVGMSVLPRRDCSAMTKLVYLTLRDPRYRRSPRAHAKAIADALGTTTARVLHAIDVLDRMESLP